MEAVLILTLVLEDILESNLMDGGQLAAIMKWPSVFSVLLILSVWLLLLTQPQDYFLKFFYQALK